MFSCQLSNKRTGLLSFQNPCDDKRHRKILADESLCYKLPDFIIIGPQKTGTTALFTFLTMHPSLLHSYKSFKTYEEVQFFQGSNYFKGLNW